MGHWFCPLWDGVGFVFALQVNDMFKKIALSLVLMMVGTLSASAQETETEYHYIGVQGSWWNSDYAGEGFAIEEFGDGFMIAYWYTYGDMGQQMWLIGTGERDGNTVVLEMRQTEGGVMADPSNRESVTEFVWGTVTLNITDCGHIDMTYESLDGLQVGGYTISKLDARPLAAGSCNAIQLDQPAPPETDPPEEDEEPPVVEPPAPEVSVTLQKRNATGQWEDVAIPFWGLAVINKSYVGNPHRIELFRLRIVVEDGEAVIGNVSATEPTGIGHPSVEGIWSGMSFPEGSEIVFSLESNMTGGVRIYNHYSVFVEGVGEIVNLTVRLSTQSL